MVKATIKTVHLPAHPGQYVTIPKKLGGKRRVAINSATNPSDIVGFDARGNPQFRPAIDFNAGAWECLLQALTHEDANWNLTGEDGKPLSRDRVTIENDTEYEDDFVAISPEIYRFIMSDEDQSAEGNVVASSPPPDDDSSSKNSTVPRRARRK